MALFFPFPHPAAGRGSQERTFRAPAPLTAEPTWRVGLVLILAALAPLWASPPALAMDLSGTLTGTVTLPAGDHHLTGGLTIAAGGQLLLQPGAHLIADGNYGISVYGSLSAQGTAAAPCLFTAGSTSPGSWQGLWGMSGGTISLTHTTLRYAHTALTANGASLTMADCSVVEASLDGVAVYGASSISLSSCEFTDLGRRGLFLETTSPTGTVGACTFERVGEYPILAKATLVELLEGPFAFTDVALPYIGVSCSADEDITDADTWPWLGADYDLTAGSSDELTIAATGHLTLAAGVRLRCGRVRVEGTLEADGSTSTVYLYGPSGEAGPTGDWPGLEVAGGTLDLTRVRIARAETAITADGGHVHLASCWLDDSKYDGLWATGGAELQIDDTQVRGAGRSGLRLVAANLTGLIANSSFADCGSWPIYALPNTLGMLGEGLSFTNPGVEALGVNCALSSDVTTSQTWRPQPLPYDLSADPGAVLVTIVDGRTLHIAAGTRLANGGLQVRGRLEIQGTSDEPVVLGSSHTPPTPGDCQGIFFRSGSTGYIQGCIIEYAPTGLTITDASPRVDNVRLQHNSADGLAVSGASARPVVTSSFLVDNGRYGVFISDGAAPVLGNVGNASDEDDGENEIHGNGGSYDLYNASSSNIKAENNWWGTTSQAAIEARLRDHADYAAAGVVDFQPFRGGPANSAPQLAWVGVGDWAASGVSPPVGTPSDDYVFKVRYQDAEANEPQFVRVHIYDSGSEIAASPLDLVCEDASPDYAAGAVFAVTTSLPSSRHYSYRFEAMDWQLPAVGAPTEKHAGPLVTTPPELAWTGQAGYEHDGLDPESGFAEDTVFEFRVLYRDADGDGASGVFLHLTLDNHPIAGSPFSMERVSGNPTQGAVYRCRLTLSQASSDGYRYHFSASDGLMAATGSPTHNKLGPSVQYRPKLSYVGDTGYERDGVEPQAAEAGSSFRFRVIYQHRGNRAPQRVRVHVLDAGTEIPGSPFAMSPANSQPFSEGRTYEVSLNLSDSRHYTHWFDAYDGTYHAFGPATNPADGPLADTAPRLKFPADGPCQDDGLDPATGGLGATEFTWRVVYSDADGDQPLFVMLRLYCNGQELPDSPCIMQPLIGGDFQHGKTYEIRKRLARLGNYRYSFVASDGYLPARGPATGNRSGPNVAGAFELTFPSTPGLADDGLFPNSGRPDRTPFTFAVLYRHPDDVSPAFVRMKLRREGSTTDVSSYDLTAADDAPYSQGRTFEVTLALPQASYSYWFEASDGTYQARTDELPGPVLNHRPVLEWVGEDGWTKDGVHPDTGEAGQTTFVFRVRYYDEDNDPATRAAIYLYTSSDYYPFRVGQMTPENSSAPAEGVLYRYETSLPYSPQGYHYRFVFDDGYGEAEGAPAVKHAGPTVRQVSSSGVLLLSVTAQTTTHLTVIHAHLSDRSPASQVGAKVMNLAGRAVAQLAPVVPDSLTGIATLYWNYTNRQGAPVPPGMYLLLVEATGAGGNLARRLLTLDVRR